jgi:serralysin
MAAGTYNAFLRVVNSTPYGDEILPITLDVGNSAPVADAQSVTTDEDTAKAITLTATDADLDTLTYSVVAQPLHGDLTGTAPVLTYTPDADYNGPDSFTFKANDGAVDSNIATVSITVTATADAPVITSDDGGATASKNVAENSTAVTTVTATDADLDTLIYSISGGADAALFSINASTGVLTFISAPDFENPADVGANNTYEVIVQVSDGAHTATQTITVTVTDTNDILYIYLPLINR